MKHSMYQVKEVGGKTIKLPELDSLEVTNQSNAPMDVATHEDKIIFKLNPGDKITATPVWDIKIEKTIVVPAAVENIPLNIVVGVDPAYFGKDQTKAVLMDKDGKVVGLIENLGK